MHTNTPLIIVIGGYATPKSRYDSLIATIKKEFPHAPLPHIPTLPLGLFSTANLNQIVEKLAKQIDSIWAKLNDEQRSSRIIIIGHSIGSLVARKLYVVACGENPDAPFEKEFTNKQIRAWAGKVERIILFAGFNKGWTFNAHFKVGTAIIFSILIFLGKIMTLFGLRPVPFQTRKGAPFITQLRIQSLSMQNHVNDKHVGEALIIQMLGSEDSIVSPNDNIDLITGKNFVYIDIPSSNHSNVVKMAVEEGKSGEERKLRRDIFVNSLQHTKEKLKILYNTPVEDESNIHLLRRDEDVSDVVFVIHGIRDTGYWTHKIARKIKQLGDKANREMGGVEAKKKYATETSTYGYFAMLPFLLSPYRRAKVEWFMNEYTENLALYPNARFSFIGHSNGTYLLAKALSDYPACKFKNVVLAGSVVKRDYNWKKLIEEKRVENVFNFVANNDWVVGTVPKILQQWKIEDLGSGGYDGFIHLPKSAQFKYIKGGHGAAVKEIMWDEIAHIAVHGEPNDVSNYIVKKRSTFVKALSLLTPVFLPILIILVLVLGIFIFYVSPTILFKFTFTILYFYIIWKILTWF
jgi:pimeloyl-ACP methyl ester carboxylesterase